MLVMLKWKKIYARVNLAKNVCDICNKSNNILQGEMKEGLNK